MEDKDGVFLPEFCNFLSSEESALVVIKKGYFTYDLMNSFESLAALRDINLEIPTGLFKYYFIFVKITYVI